MSYNGSGTFQINTSGQPVVTGTSISSTAFNALTADLATGLSTAITKDGQTTTTARIPFALGINSTLVTDATNTTSGSIITAGGVGIAKALYVGTTANVAGVATLTSNPVLSAGTANGVAYLNGSKVLTTGSALVFDGTNLGVGTSSPVGDANRVVAVAAAGGAGFFMYDTNQGSTVTDGANIQVAGTNFYIYNKEAGFVAFGQNNLERARIDSSGNLLVGKTTSAGSTLGGQLNANGQIFSTVSGSTDASTTFEAYSTGASAYRFYIGMGGTIFATSTVISAISDIRFKENVRDLNVGLSEIMALKPRLYDWKEGKGANIKNARGFIAQEFVTVFPDLIDEWKDPAPEGEDPYKSVRQDLIPVLVKAIQEQQALITTLTARITALESA